MAKVRVKGDAHNTIEHLIRELYIDALLRFGNKVAPVMDPVPRLYVSFLAHTEHGTWTVRSFNPDLSTSGAELMLAVDAHAEVCIMAAQIDKLSDGDVVQSDNDV